MTTKTTSIPEGGFIIGDKVRVVDKDSAFYGTEGTVVKQREGYRSRGVSYTSIVITLLDPGYTGRKRKGDILELYEYRYALIEEEPFDLGEYADY